MSRLRVMASVSNMEVQWTAHHQWFMNCVNVRESSVY
jgi:hypothetical protein